MSDNKETNGKPNMTDPFMDETSSFTSLLKQLEEEKKQENAQKNTTNNKVPASETSTFTKANSCADDSMSETSNPAERIANLDGKISSDIEKKIKKEILSGVKDSFKDQVAQDPEFGWNLFLAFGKYVEENKALKEENEALKAASAELTEEKETSSVLRTTVIILIIVAAVLAILAYSCSKSNTETAQELTDLQWEYGIIYDEYTFYHDYAVIVSSKGKYYHSYGCEKLGTPDSFYIFNIDNAKAQGYKKCKTCQD